MVKKRPDGIDIMNLMNLMNLKKIKYLPQLGFSVSLLLLSSEAFAKEITFNCSVEETHANWTSFDGNVKWENKGTRDFSFTLETETPEVYGDTGLFNNFDYCKLSNSKLKCGTENDKIMLDLNRSTLKLSMDRYYDGRIDDKFRGRCSIANNAF
ncbi:hypothetical protein NBRC116592_03740 [Colwellia sp. KU-HH00111]|uniref:hypothetical protein n=1 Tax=Colwellia sp. KU-HH00111 TaxID=3127652 RepID=UPI0031067240